LEPLYGLGLLYDEPVTDLKDADRDLLIRDDRFFLESSPKIKPVKLEPDIIPPLLRRVREIRDPSESPPGQPGCRDCCILKTLIQATSGVS
jgi:hypothetical protein